MNVVVICILPHNLFEVTPRTGSAGSSHGLPSSSGEGVRARLGLLAGGLPAEGLPAVVLAGGLPAEGLPAVVVAGVLPVEGLPAVVVAGVLPVEGLSATALVAGGSGAESLFAFFAGG